MAYYRDKVTLVKITTDPNNTNDVGDPVETETTLTVFANDMGVGQSEKYQAKAQGINAAKKFKIRIGGFNKLKEPDGVDPQFFEHQGIRYKLLRDYNGGNREWIEITGESLVI